MVMSSSRPYMIRALYEWILDNSCTPYVLVSAKGSGVQVPLEHVKDGQIILNISPSAVQSFLINNDALEFSGRFSGVPTRVFVPIPSIVGIYAKENGQGMFFEFEEISPEPPTVDAGGTGVPEKSAKDNKPKTIRPSLRVVK